jgi:hypothetical protein
VLDDLAACYPHKVMWGSDSPAHSYASSFGGISLSLWSSYDREAAYLHAVAACRRSAVASQNALACLGAPWREASARASRSQTAATP